jgi:hypothetical protein
MIRLRIAAVAAATSLAFGAVAVPAVAASKASGSSGSAYNFRALYTVPVTGATKGGKQFKGSFGIQRFVVKHHKAMAVGTLTGKIAGQKVTKTGVMMPANLTGAPTGSARDAASCPILNLVLGPIHLNLLGLVVNLGGNGGTTPITLNITAISGPGNLLGNLLCGVSNLLNSGGTLTALQSDVSGLTAALNGLLGVISGL